MNNKERKAFLSLIPKVLKIRRGRLFGNMVKAIPAENMRGLHNAGLFFYFDI
jgi:hypothetical protein